MEFHKKSLDDALILINLIKVIMSMIRRSSCRLLWNGEITDAIRSLRGIRQGDPLSPYLFVLCMERLSRWILNNVEQGLWKYLKASRNSVRISHLFFANDLLLFAEAGIHQIDCINEGLERFCATSGQKINFSKSFVYFSPNIPEDVA